MGVIGETGVAEDSVVQGLQSSTKLSFRPGANSRPVDSTSACRAVHLSFSHQLVFVLYYTPNTVLIGRSRSGSLPLAAPLEPEWRLHCPRT